MRELEWKRQYEMGLRLMREEGWEFDIISYVEMDEIREMTHWCYDTWGPMYDDGPNMHGEWIAVPITNSAGLIDNMAYGFQNPANLTCFLLQFAK